MNIQEERYIKEIERCQRLLTKVVEKDPLYPKMDVDLILKTIKDTYDKLQTLRSQTKTGLENGCWVQIFSSWTG
jgi:hypothetical protein